MLVCVCERERENYLRYGLLRTEKAQNPTSSLIPSRASFRKIPKGGRGSLVPRPHPLKNSGLVSTVRVCANKLLNVRKRVSNIIR